jgi:alpha-L-fucosidase
MLRLSLALVLLATLAHGQLPYQAAPSNLATRRAFQDAKFGMFIHWGVYSVLGDGEWVMQNKKIPIAEYEKLPIQFNPDQFDAAAWVALAKAAGMRYIVITSKHHDGFAMFGSHASDWTIVQRTPWKKDPLALLADECRKQGIRLGFYYSQLDWHNPDYFPRGTTGQYSGRPDRGDWDKYLAYQDSQLRELLTNYGDISAIWFDGWWDKPDADWHLDRTYSLIHSLQPQTLIGNNRHRTPVPGEDFQMFEQDLPGQNKTGFSADEPVSDLPLETAATINQSWGYNASDHSIKSTRELVQLLVRAAGSNANLLLNIGPRPDGTIQPEFVERLQEVGQWLAANGDSIYSTRGGPISPHPWGVTTQKGNTVFVHILDWPDAVLLVPQLPKPVLHAHTLGGASDVSFKPTDDGVVLKLPPRDASTIDVIVVLEMAP